jgi:hypothetical protein
MKRWEKVREKMNKPNNPKCDTCFVVNNILRCWQCKYRTQEWEQKNIVPIMIVGESDLYKPNSETVLDKIRTEIEQSRQCYEVSMDYGDAYREQELSWVLELIDKYSGKDYNK